VTLNVVVLNVANDAAKQSVVMLSVVAPWGGFFYRINSRIWNPDSGLASVGYEEGGSSFSRIINKPYLIEISN
jgi:hypothetical protein